MSLQVWLPLNGNIENHGLLGNVSVTTSPTYADSGKIGKCLKSGGLYMTASQAKSVLNNKEFSFACWVYPNRDTGTSTSSIYPNTMLFNKDGVGPYRQYSIFIYPNINSLHLSWQSKANEDTLSTIISNIFPSYTWTHLCITYNNPTVRVYVNGVLSNTFFANINCSSYEYNTPLMSSSDTRYLNDYRVYDHCLSAKEVKEIGKGLVCHYKLDNNGFGNPNLFSNSHFDSRYTVSDWDTSKNGDLCANGWGGYNGGVGNPSTVYHAHLQEHEGEYVYNYHKTSNEEWLGISQYITGSVEVSKTYTFSCELKRISGKNFANGGLYTKANSSAINNTFVNWFEFSEFNSVTDNKWHKYSYTFTIDSSVYLTNGAYWYIYGHSWEDGEFLMRRPKLEEGSSTTPWCPHTSDSLYTSLGLDSTTESDCSGLSNNGTKIGGLTPSTSPSSIRYESCYNFDGNTGSIQIPNLAKLAPSGEFTMNCWIYHDNTWSSKGYETIFGGPSGFELEAKPSSTNSPSLFAYSWGQGQATYELNKWNMITMTRNASESKFYINGELKITGSAGTIPSGNYFIGAWNTSSQQNYKGRISDFRLYSTVLSVEDIKELYNTSASIDKNGNMYAYEFKEE